ncbi:PEGA domain-containing protein, partial [candidate division TA06 bacterium]|nr:PEGA domain-containing protein [candidate division TA06 bacterium]
MTELKDKIEEIFSQADQSARQGDRLGAIASLTEATSLPEIAQQEPLSLECAHWGLAGLLIAERDVKQAEVHLKAVIKLNPQEAGYFQELGALYNYHARFQEAALQFEQSLKLRPGHPETTHLLGWAVFMSGDLKRGQKILELALELDENNAGTVNDLAVCLMEQGKIKEAQGFIGKALELDPDNELLRSFREMLEGKTGRLIKRKKQKGETMRKIFCGAVAAILLALPAVASAQKLQVSVMDLNVTSGLTPQEAVMLTDCLLNEFITIGAFKVVDRSNRDNILKEQGFQQSGACDQGACLVEAGQLLGAHKMFGGTVGKMGVKYAVQLRMIDVKTGEADMAFTRQYSGDVSALLDAMKEAATEFSKWKSKPKAQAIAETKAETGNLKVVSTPAGATIFLDGPDVGTTPGLLTKIEIGEHQIIVTRDGYSSFSKTVTVAKNITTT